jgi:AcrR family transcriptional regulator
MKEAYDIQERVLALFVRYGIRSITMNDIARELGISKKTLYNDFKDKEDLIKQVIDFDKSQSRKFLDELYESEINALEEIHRVNSRIHSYRSRYSPSFYYDLKRYFPETYRKWIQDKRQNMYDLITKNLRKGKEEGFYRMEIREHIIARLYMARIEMLDSSEIIEEHETLSAEFMQEIFFYHLHGICNEKGLKVLTEFKESIENHQVKQS